MSSFRQTGSVLITLIIAMLLLGVLGVGIYSLTTASSFTGLLSNSNDQAYQLAQAGIRYKIKNLSDTNTIGDFRLPDDKHMFNIAYNDTTKIITSTGIVNAGTFFEARRVITYDVATYWKLPDTSSGGTITPGPGTNPNELGGDAIVTNPDGSFNLGNNISDSSGSIWYQGSSSAGNCNSGACAFNYGLRAYFDLTSTEDNSADSMFRGDGFTFTVLSAINNTRDRTGGAPPGASMGELLGYAGPGNTSDKLGLKPPKMAMEFDTYPNTGALTYNGCSGGRNDNSNNNHIAWLFWGLNPSASTMCSASSTVGNTYPQASFDDNIHGQGSGDTSPPVNSYYGYAGGGYYEGTKSLTTSNCLSAPGTLCNWMEDGHTYSARVEIIRITSGTGGLYKVMGWIYRDTELPTALAQYRDITSPYTSTSPQITRTVTLSAADHNALSQVFFGFTEGTGGRNQNIKISNFKAFFPLTCPAIINPVSQAVAYGGATGQTISVTAGTGCAWTAVSNNAWITITGGASGAGPGTVTYGVAANTGTARTGTIIVAGQTLAVNQGAAPPPTCTLVDSPHILPYNNTTTLTWTITNGPADGIWSSSPGGTCGDFTASNGGSCTTGNQITAGARTYTLTVSNATGSNTCSTTFYVGCSGYTVYNSTGDRRYFAVTGSGCVRVRDGNAITNNSLNTGDTISRCSLTDFACSSPLGSINYTNAMNADILPNGGNGNCQVNYNNNDTVSDH